MLNKSYFSKFLIFSILTIVVSVPTLQGQTTKEVNNSQSNNKKQEDTLSLIESTYPIVEYSNQSFLEPDRILKSKKYDRYQILFPDINQDTQSVLHDHWVTDLPALPIEESQIIVIAKVVDAQAHLSSQKKSVYSEFKIEVEKVYKNSTQQKIEDGKYIRAERDGGIVRYPSGIKVWSIVSGQRMPKVGSRYVFFLTHGFTSHAYQKQDSYLLTGYELKDGRVLPLDNPGGGTHPIEKFYRGKEESILLNDLEKAIKP